MVSRVAGQCWSLLAHVEAAICKATVNQLLKDGYSNINCEVKMRSGADHQFHKGLKQDSFFWLLPVASEPLEPAYLKPAGTLVAGPNTKMFCKACSDRVPVWVKDKTIVECSKGHVLLDLEEELVNCEQGTLAIVGSWVLSALIALLCSATTTHTVTLK